MATDETVRNFAFHDVFQWFGTSPRNFSRGEARLEPVWKEGAEIETFPANRQNQVNESGLGCKTR